MYLIVVIVNTKNCIDPTVGYSVVKPIQSRIRYLKVLYSMLYLVGRSLSTFLFKNILSRKYLKYHPFKVTLFYSHFPIEGKAKLLEIVYVGTSIA